MQIEVIERKTIDIDKELEALIEATNDMQRGDFISYEKIEETTKVLRRRKNGTHDPKWDKIVGKWKDYHKKGHREDGQRIVIATVKTSGFKFMTAKEQVDAGYQEEVSGIRKVAKSAWTAGVVDPNELDEDYQERQKRIVQHSDAMVKERNQSASRGSCPLIKVMPRVRING